MTRQEFLDEINDFSDLLNFCCDHGLYYMEDVTDDIAACLAEDLRDYAREYSWTEIRDWLNGIEDGGSWYRRDGSFDYVCIDDDFEEWKREVMLEADEIGTFEEEDEECEPEPEQGQLRLEQDEDLFSAPSADWMPCAGEIQEAAYQYREAAIMADAAIREIRPW